MMQWWCRWRQEEEELTAGEARNKLSAMSGGQKQSDKYSWSCRRCYTETPPMTSLAAGILLALVCILACSTLGESRYEAVDVTLDEFDFYTTHSYDPLYVAFSEALNNATLDETYNQLIPSGHKNMYLVPLGRGAALYAARTLGRYKHGSTPEPPLKMALLQIMIMVSEALRFRSIREQFCYQWETESHLTELQSEYVMYWADLSRLLLIWERDKVWDSDSGLGKLIREKIHVTNANQALEIVDFLRRPEALRVADDLSV